MSTIELFPTITLVHRHICRRADRGAIALAGLSCLRRCCPEPVEPPPLRFLCGHQGRHCLGMLFPFKIALVVLGSWLSTLAHCDAAAGTRGRLPMERRPQRRREGRLERSGMHGVRRSGYRHDLTAAFTSIETRGAEV